MMQVSNINDIKIYNLSAGKSLPEWLDEKKRRQLLRNDENLRRRIELLQEFDMPAVSQCVSVSKDGQYIIATGTYKPRIKCYDTNQLSLKFERCFDSEVLKFILLSDDYSKIIFLHSDRYVEIHSQFGRYYRLRIPRFGRDMAYQEGTCDVLFVGACSEIFRLNLEQGRFLNPFVAESVGLNVCTINSFHKLFVTGGVEGKIECWDTRFRTRVGTLDCAMQTNNLNNLPGITALCFRDSLNLAVGTSTGNVLLYDLRSSKPLLSKDHMFDAPIKRIAFHSSADQVLSLDSHVLKIWDRKTGTPYTSIETSDDAELNDFVVYPNSGLVFMTNEQPKIQVHYLPSLGPAPRWCSFLDNLTEELEENTAVDVYDDYKFVTNEELIDLGLDHLIGSDLLRAYMHGYFMDVRLYTKARSLSQPYSMEKYMRDKIESKLEEQREKRVDLKSILPTVNKELFMKVSAAQSSLEAKKKVKKKNIGVNLLDDERFKSIFSDPRFEVDTNEEAYRLINPVVSKLDVKLKTQKDDGSEASLDDSSSSSEDDTKEENWTEVRKQYRLMSKEKSLNLLHKSAVPQQLYNLKISSGLNSEGCFTKRKTQNQNRHTSLGELLQRNSQDDAIISSHMEGHEMLFTNQLSKKQKKEQEDLKEHREERRKLRRSANSLVKKRIAPKFWKGKRVA